jgi:DNA-directed RNA polymerase specialized sigma24 family protein
MQEHAGTAREADRQLAELLADPGFAKVLLLLVAEVRRHWRMGPQGAHRIVLSAIGEPAALASIHAAAMRARDAGQKPTLAGVISRRRVIDLLRKDARRREHRSLPAGSQAIEQDPAFRALSAPGEEAPDAQLLRSQRSVRVRGAISAFAEQSPDCARQADLLRRRVCEDTAYRDLARELNCSENALRGRMCAAKTAFGKFIEHRYPDLQDVVARWGR